MNEIYPNLIAGDWIDGEAAPNINPSDISDVIGEYARATKADTVAAIDAADLAFAAWSRSDPMQRHSILRKTAEEIRQRREELGRLLSREEGKTLVGTDPG